MPYPRRYKNGKNQATGVAMDCSNSPDGVIQPSLEIFYDAIKKHMGRSIEYPISLDYLLDQGVMMLNTDLTCKLNKTGSHEGLWEPFQKFFLENILGSKRLIYILSGKSSERMEKYISPLGNTIIKTEHPMAAGHKHVAWNDKGVFGRIDKILRNGNERIYWDKKDWVKKCDPPF